jgi:hypothetical protein
MVMVLCYGEGGLWRLVVETKYDSLKGAWCIEEVASPFKRGSVDVDVYKEGVGSYLYICYI